jgi:hypothetical protein
MASLVEADRWGRRLTSSTEWILLHQGTRIFGYLGLLKNSYFTVPVSVYWLIDKNSTIIIKVSSSE